MPSVFCPSKWQPRSLAAENGRRKNTMEVMLWQNRFREYLQMRNLAASTVLAYTREVRPFLELMTTCGLASVAGLTRTHLEEYRTELFYQEYRGRRLTLKTQSARLNAVRCFVRFLVRQEYLLVDVAAGLDLPKVPRSLPRTVLSEPEALRLLERPELGTTLGLRDRAILEILYGTAIRNAELRLLTLGQLDWARKLLQIHGKGDKMRLVPLGEEAEIWLEEYLAKARPLLARAGSPPLVFLSSRGKKLTSACLSARVLCWARQSGLTKHVTPHCLRHSCATHMLRRGANLRYLQELLGHSQAQTTELYTRVELSDLRKVLLRCHPRERKP